MNLTHVVLTLLIAAALSFATAGLLALAHYVLVSNTALMSSVLQTTLLHTVIPFAGAIPGILIIVAIVRRRNVFFEPPRQRMGRSTKMVAAFLGLQVPAALWMTGALSVLHNS